MSKIFITFILSLLFSVLLLCALGIYDFRFKSIFFSFRFKRKTNKALKKQKQKRRKK